MLYIASDHAGFEVKEIIKKYLNDKSIMFEDLGPEQYSPADDYPDFAFPLAEKVVEEDSKGLLLCGSGGGMTIAANKVKGARAIFAETIEQAERGRTDDDANILILDSRTFDYSKDFRIIEVFLDTQFSKSERHIRRINKIKEYES